MENINKKKLVSFSYEISFIKYKQIKSNFIRDDYEDEKFNKFIYNEVLNLFLIYCKNTILIINGKGEKINQVKTEVKDEIKTLTIDNTKSYLLIITNRNRCEIINIKNNIRIFIEVSTSGVLVDGFFYKDNTDGIKICLIKKDNFSISKISIEEYEKENKNINLLSQYISDKINFDAVYYNNEFNVLIFKISNTSDFLFFNLKNEDYLKQPIKINLFKNDEENINGSSSLFLQKIYNNLYIVNFNTTNISFNKLDNLNKAVKKTKKIIYKQNEDNFKKECIKIQFLDNLLFLYNLDLYNIKIFDIKSQAKNYLITMVKINNTNLLETIKISNIYDKYIVDYKNKIVYKAKFFHELFLENSKINDLDSFFFLVRRKKNYNIIKNVLIKFLESNQMTKFYTIALCIIEKYAKYIKKKLDTSSYRLKKVGIRRFSLSPENIFSVFNVEIKNQSPINIINLVSLIYSSLKKKGIKFDVDIFVSIIIHQLNKINDLTFIEFLIKNKTIPVNKNLALYFIGRSKSFKSIQLKKKFFNIGIDILNLDKRNIKLIIQELVCDEKIEETINILNESYKENVLAELNKKDLGRLSVRSNSMTNLKRYISFSFVDLSYKNDNRKQSVSGKNLYSFENNKI